MPGFVLEGHKLTFIGRVEAFFAKCWMGPSSTVLHWQNHGLKVIKEFSPERYFHEKLEEWLKYTGII
jgi:hypothetical protein